MKFIVTLILLFIFLSGLSQTTKEKLNEKEVSLNILRQQLADSLKKIDQQIEKIKTEKQLITTASDSRLDSLKKVSPDSSMFIVKPIEVGMGPPELYDIPNGRVVYRVQKDETLKIIEVYDLDFVKVTSITSSAKGYISRFKLIITQKLVDHIRKVVDERDKPRLLKEKQDKINAERTRKTKLVQKYGQQIAQQILDGKIWIGMSVDHARESLGKPESINESVGSWGKNEQWVYNNLNLYFKNGIMESYQMRR